MTEKHTKQIITEQRRYRNADAANLTLEEIEKVLGRFSAWTKQWHSLSSPPDASIDRLVLPEDYTKRAVYYLMRIEKLLRMYADHIGQPRAVLGKQIASLIDTSLPSETDLYEIKVTPGAVHIRMPYLPHRNSASAAITDGLAAKLYVAAELPQNWKCCCIEFCHVYPAKVPKRIKDNDNYNYKRVIDIIAYALRLTDDAGTIHYSMRTAFTDFLYPGTYIKLSEKSSEIPDFPI